MSRRRAARTAAVLGTATGWALTTGPRATSAAPDDWRIAWRVPIADPWQAPVVAGDSGLVLLIERNAVVAVDAGNGAVAWRHELEVAAAIGCACLGAPAVAPEARHVYAVSAGNELRALDLASGRIVWRRRAGEQVITRPVVAGGGVVVATAEGDGLAVMAFDAAGGALRWRSGESRRLLPDPLWDSRTESVYVLDAAGNLRALDAATGRVRWETAGEAADGGAAQAPLSPAGLVDGALAVIRERGLELLEPATGAVRWRYAPADGWLAWAVGVEAAGPTAAEPDRPGAAIVLAGGWAEAVVALDARSGERRWAIPAGGGAFTEPAAGGGTVVLATGDDLVASRVEDGAEVWRQSARSVTGPPVLALGDGWVVVGAGDRVRAWEAASGAPVADLRLDGGIIGSPAVAAGRLYVQTLATRGPVGYAYALAAEGGN